MRSLTDYPDAALRQFDRPPLPLPSDIDSVYLVGICGKGMGAFAELLVDLGVSVRGSDEAAYPPMSDRLADLGIPVDTGYHASNLRQAQERGEADLIVIGNACTPTHPEATFAREKGLVQASFPEALAHLVLSRRRPVVVAGTHGKTTTTGLTTHLLRTAGLVPGVLVGGVMVNDGATAAPGTDGGPFVIEGDEYDSAYFDKRPKMWLYRPQVAVVTSLEFDHADIYDDWDDYQDAFRRFIRKVPSETGRLVLCGDDPAVRALAASAEAPVTFYGLNGDNTVRATEAQSVEGGQRFILHAPGVEPLTVTLPMAGAFNRRNALAAAAVALGEGAPPNSVAEGLATFRGMRRRQEVKGEPGGVLVIDDFAHHPTAVAATLEAVRERWAPRLKRGGRLVAVFEPRSNSSRRKLFEDRYAQSFDAADRVFLSAPPLRHNDSPDDFIDPQAVAQAVTSRGAPASAHPGAEALLPDLLDTLRPDDLALVMSNGSFDGLVGRLTEALDE